MAPSNGILFPDDTVFNKTVAQIAADLSTNYKAAAYVFEGV